MKGILFVLSLLFCLSLGNRPRPTWEIHTPSGVHPVNISAHVMVATSNKLVLFGGHQEYFNEGTITFFNDVYVVNVDTNRWIKKPTPGPRPAGRAYAAAVYSPAQRLMYLFGGATFNSFYGDFTPFNDMWTYSVDTDRWTKLSFSGPVPATRAAPFMVIAHRYIYLFGGVTTSDSNYEVLNDLWRFDTLRNTWKRLIANGDPRSPPPRQIAVGGYLPLHNSFIINGGEIIDGGDFVEAKDTWIYRINTNTWKDVTPERDEDNLLPPRNYAAAGTFANKLVFYGGDAPGGSAGCGAPFGAFFQNVKNETWVFDPRPNKGVWSLVDTANSIEPKKRAAFAVLGNRLCLHGGYDFECDENGVGPGQVFPPGRNIYCLKISNI